MAKPIPRLAIASLAVWAGVALSLASLARAEEAVDFRVAETSHWINPVMTPPPPPEAALAQPIYEMPPEGEPVWTPGHYHDPCHDCDDSWYFQLLPQSILYKAYLANLKESRLSWRFSYAMDHGWFFDGDLGGRFGIFRYGTGHAIRPKGFQLDVEASAQVRLDPTDDVDVRAVDFRGGLPFTIGYGEFGQYQTKIAYYHISSHLGDEFLLKNPDFDRQNYVRDEIVLGHAIYLNENLRIYGEIGWAFFNDVADPWEVQFGLDYAPAYVTGLRGAPFFAVNGHLREELAWGGNFTVQVGWAWRSDESARLLRVGLHYYNGKSSQYSFYNYFDHLIGFGAWYDY